MREGEEKSTEPRFAGPWVRDKDTGARGRAGYGTFVTR